MKSLQDCPSASTYFPSLQMFAAVGRDFSMHILLMNAFSLRQQQVQQIKHLSVWSDSVQSAAKAEAEGS
eukprot:scaffold6795_cov25-Tisochrysis_lutea.AAC.3